MTTLLTLPYRLFATFTKALFLLVLAIGLFLGFTYLTLPNVSFLIDSNPKVSSYMLSDDDEGFEQNFQPVQFIPMSQISSSVVQAVLSSEDDLFFLHEGFNLDELEKSAKLNWKKKKFARGGSTITQQLARNLFLSKNKSLFRKFYEAILTHELETTLSKARILELYLNFAEFGPHVYGIKNAAQYHFNKQPSQIGPSEASLLAAVLPRPKVYGKKPYPHYTLFRQNQILSRIARYDLHFPKDLFKKDRLDREDISEEAETTIVKTTPKEKKKLDKIIQVVTPQPDPIEDQPANVILPDEDSEQTEEDVSVPEYKEEKVFLDE